MMVINMVQAVELEPSVQMQPLGSNVTYQPAVNINMTDIVIDDTEFTGNGVSSYATGNVTFKIVKFEPSNVRMNTSGTKVNLNFSSVQAGLNFYYGSLEWVVRVFSVDVVEGRILYTGTPSSSGTGGSDTTTFAEISDGTGDKECEEKGGVYYENKCYTCNGQIFEYQEALYCRQCEGNYTWDGATCILNAQEFSIERNLKNLLLHYPWLIGVMFIAGGYFIFFFYKKEKKLKEQKVKDLKKKEGEK
jgi:hypothetical protein